jgi:hypothetical protein
VTLAAAGHLVFPADRRVARWAAAALPLARDLLAKGGDRRHGGTWYPGVDALPNDANGAIAGVPLAGPWESHVTPPKAWHRAQLSVVFPGYPQQDAGENDAAHRFRRDRDAAHMDGLLPEGSQRRRHLREAHGFILGIPLNAATGSPLVVWEGSHHVMGRAMAQAFQGVRPEDWGDLDVTDAYVAARRTVLQTCKRVEVRLAPATSVLLHRHLIHGVAPWQPGATPDEGRMVAYFRPEVGDLSDWLDTPAQARESDPRAS